MDSLHTGYGDIPPYGKGPDQQQLYRQGNSYIREQFPLTDFIHSCRIMSEGESESEGVAKTDLDHDEEF